METIWDLNLAPLTHTPALTQALQEAKQCRSTVHLLYKTLCLLETGRLPFPERRAWIAAEDLVAMLTDTVLAFSDLQAICEVLELPLRGTYKTADVAAAPRPAGTTSEACDASIANLCSRIRWQSLSMNIMMTVLKCPSEADAVYARVGLERRMTRILSSNTALAHRMRQLESAWAGQALVGASEPHGLPTEAPSPSAWHRLSPMAGYTLADVPTLSIVALPVTAQVCDGATLYTVTYARLVGRSLGELAQAADKAEHSASRVLGVILGRTGFNKACASLTATESSDDVVIKPPPPPPAAKSSTGIRKSRLHKIRVRKKWRV